MTKEEYEKKTADGTLTIRDVLDNYEFATEEQKQSMPFADKVRGGWRYAEVAEMLEALQRQRAVAVNERWYGLVKERKAAEATK